MLLQDTHGTGTLKSPLKLHDFFFFFCINPSKKNLAERILPKLEGTVLLAFQKHYMLTK